jgi:DNA-binding beta-propeller fold protein YncE
MHVLGLLGSLVTAPLGVAEWDIKLAGNYVAGATGTEIVAVHAPTQRAFLTVGDARAIDVLSLADPRKPKRIARFAVEVPEGGDLTSVAVHPSGDYLLATVEDAEPGTGRVDLLDTRDGRRLARVPAGVGPDSVTVSRDGRWAAVCNEAEAYFFDRSTRKLVSAKGSVTLIDLARGPAAATTREIALPDLSGLAGVTGVAQQRKLERAVDLDGDGVIGSVVDLNGDGDTDDTAVTVGTIDGTAVGLDEGGGEAEIKIPLPSATPEHLEPELAAISPDGTAAYVVLQENNVIVVIDIPGARVRYSFALGATRHPADLVEDGRAAFTDELFAAREPDGMALTPDGRWLVTADEGDTDPKASKTKAGLPAGGGRTVSVFDAASGELMGDTGNGIDATAAAAGTYPDARSPNKGSEPEGIVAFELDGVAHAAVSLERANAVALVSLADPRAPRVVGVAPIDRSEKAGKVAPEGVAYFASPDGRHWILSGNEKKGSLSVFELTRR